MTSIEWLEKELKKYLSWSSFLEDDFEQANKMFEQQIIDAWNGGDYAYFYSKKTGRDFADGSEYYNETYGSNGSDDTPKCTCNVDPFLCQIHKKDMFEKPFMDFAKQYVEQLKPKKDY